MAFSWFWKSNIFMVMFPFLLGLFIGPSLLIFWTNIARVLSICLFKEAAFNFASQPILLFILLIFVLCYFFFLTIFRLAYFLSLELVIYLINSFTICDFEATVMSLSITLSFVAWVLITNLFSLVPTYFTLHYSSFHDPSLWRFCLLSVPNTC